MHRPFVSNFRFANSLLIQKVDLLENKTLEALENR